MADFRKLFLVLTVLALLALPLSAAIVPPRVTCTASSAPIIIRYGGLTELVGDVILVCDNTNTAQGAVDVQTNIQIFMNYSPVTNKVMNSTGSNGECPGPTPIKCVTDAVVAASWIGPAPNAPGVDDPGSDQPDYTTGLLQKSPGTDTPNQRNSILFPLVPVPAGTITYIRISNVRVTADSLQPNGIQSMYELISTNNVSISSSNVLPVAMALVPLEFQTTMCDGSSASPPTFKQCIAHNADTDKMTTTFNVQFIENFALAFKPQTNEESGEMFVGNAFTSESGYLLGDLTSPGGTTVTDVGLASTGTHLIVYFNNIPEGVHIYVTQNQTFTGTTPNLAGDDVAITASTSDDSSGEMSCDLLGEEDGHGHGHRTDQGMAAVEVALDGGAGQAEWVVDYIDPEITYQKEISFGVAVSYVPQTSMELPGLTGTPAGSVEGAIGPSPFTNDWATPIASTAPIPRFRDYRVGAEVFAIVPCVTNILFPYVTIKAGFDTGIALVNTSADSPVLATETQHGYCTMYYFDGKTDGSTPAPQKTCDVPAGGMTTFSMMTQGGVPNQTCEDNSVISTNVAVPIGWQGYAIASCRFQYGRGFAFISDTNTPSLGSQGYLPLILPSCNIGRSPNPFDAAFPTLQSSADRGRGYGRGRGGNNTTSYSMSPWPDCGEVLGN